MSEKPEEVQPTAARTQVSECCGNSLCQGKTAELEKHISKGKSYSVEETPDNRAQT